MNRFLIKRCAYVLLLSIIFHVFAHSSTQGAATSSNSFPEQSEVTEPLTSGQVGENALAQQLVADYEMAEKQGLGPRLNKKKMGPKMKSKKGSSDLLPNQNANKGLFKRKKRGKGGILQNVLFVGVPAAIVVVVAVLFSQQTNNKNAEVIHVPEGSF